MIFSHSEILIKHEYKDSLFPTDNITQHSITLLHFSFSIPFVMEIKRIKTCPIELKTRTVTNSNKWVINLLQMRHCIQPTTRHCRTKR